MLRIINDRLCGSITSIIIFFTAIYICSFSGCSTGGNIETIDNNILKEDFSDIKYILKIKLKDGESFEDKNKEGLIYFDMGDKSNAKIVYNGPAIYSDSVSKSSPFNLFRSFGIYDIVKATVLYKKDESLKYIIGGATLAAVLVFLFIANGQRNQRP